MNAKKNKCKFFASSRKGDISFRRRRYFEISLVQEDMYALEIGWGMLTYPSFYKPSRYALKKMIFINLFVVIVCIDFGNWKLKYTGRESIERLHSYFKYPSQRVYVISHLHLFIFRSEIRLLFLCVSMCVCVLNTLALMDLRQIFVLFLYVYIYIYVCVWVWCC